MKKPKCTHKSSCGKRCRRNAFGTLDGKAMCHEHLMAAYETVFHYVVMPEAVLKTLGIKKPQIEYFSP